MNSSSDFHNMYQIPKLDSKNMRNQEQGRKGLEIKEKVEKSKS